LGRYLGAKYSAEVVRAMSCVKSSLLLAQKMDLRSLDLYSVGLVRDIEDGGELFRLGGAAVWCADQEVKGCLFAGGTTQVHRMHTKYPLLTRKGST
jgi:hypothetical protein